MFLKIFYLCNLNATSLFLIILNYTVRSALNATYRFNEMFACRNSYFNDNFSRKQNLVNVILNPDGCGRYTFYLIFLILPTTFRLSIPPFNHII